MNGLYFLQKWYYYIMPATPSWKWLYHALLITKPLLPVYIYLLANSITSIPFRPVKRINKCFADSKFPWKAQPREGLLYVSTIVKPVNWTLDHNRSDWTTIDQKPATVCFKSGIVCLIIISQCRLKTSQSLLQCWIPLRNLLNSWGSSDQPWSQSSLGWSQMKAVFVNCFKYNWTAWHPMLENLKKAPQPDRNAVNECHKTISIVHWAILLKRCCRTLLGCQSGPSGHN